MKLKNSLRNIQYLSTLIPDNVPTEKNLLQKEHVKAVLTVHTFSMMQVLAQCAIEMHTVLEEAKWLLDRNIGEVVVIVTNFCNAYVPSHACLHPIKISRIKQILNLGHANRATVELCVLNVKTVG